MFFLRVINSIAFSLLSMHELLTLAQRIHVVIQRFFGDNPVIGEQLAKLEQAIQRLTKAFQMAAASHYTELLAKMDRSRDAAFQSLTAFLDGLASVKVEFDLQAPAQRLLDIITKYGRGLYRLGYSQQSAITQTMIDELSQPENMALLEQTGAVQFFNMVVNTQNEFEDLYQNKLSDEGVKNYPDARESAADIIYRLCILLSNVDAMAHDEPQTHKGVAGEINAVISNIMTPARARETRSQNAGESQEIPEQPINSIDSVEPDVAPGLI
ncbi:MAG: DUF6261 family protein [Chitinivibrionales bacterium]